MGYAPHAGLPAPERAEFFRALRDVEESTPARHFLVLLLDANATLPVGTGGARFAPPHTAPNGNTDLFAELLTESSLVACNAYFERSATQLATFFGPLDRKACLDYVCVRATQRPSVLDARVVQDSDATVASDHRLVYARIRLRFPGAKPRRRHALPVPDLKALRRVLKHEDKMSAEEKANVKYREDFLAVFNARGQRQQLRASPAPSDLTSTIHNIATQFNRAAQVLPRLPPRRPLAAYRLDPAVVTARQQLRRNRDPNDKARL